MEKDWRALETDNTFSIDERIKTMLTPVNAMAAWALDDVNSSTQKS